jgi:hypothetical protein
VRFLADRKIRNLRPTADQVYGHASKQQLDGERVPETVGMTARDFRKSKKLRCPVSYCAF